MDRSSKRARTFLFLILLSGTQYLLGCKSACRPGTVLQNGVCVYPQTGSGTKAESDASVESNSGSSPATSTGMNVQAGAGSSSTPKNSGTPPAANPVPAMMMNGAPANQGNTTPAGVAGSGSEPGNNPSSGSNSSGSADSPGAANTPGNPSTSGNSSSPSGGAGDAGAADMSVDPEPKCTPAAEECDGQDNDCDSSVDEEIEPMQCGKNVGICKTGTLQCRNGQWDTQCQDEVVAQTEVCDVDRLDEDCNGTPNDGCACVEGETMECGEGPFMCKKGTITCVNGRPSACAGEVKGVAEACDGKDNDCDGTNDNGGDRLCARATPFCDGTNGSVQCRQDIDCPRQNSACQVARCGGNRSCSVVSAPSGTSCNANGGRVCSEGSCVACLKASDCGSGFKCSNQKCERSQVCGNGTLEPGEDCEAGQMFCDAECRWLYRSCTGGCPTSPAHTCFNGRFCTPSCSGAGANCNVGGNPGFCYNQTNCLMLCNDSPSCPPGSSCTAIGSAGMKACL